MKLGFDWAKDAVSKDHALSAGLVFCTTCGKRKQVDSAACLRGGWPKCCGYTMSLNPPISKAEKIIDQLHDRPAEHDLATGRKEVVKQCSNCGSTDPSMEAEDVPQEPARDGFLDYGQHDGCNYLGLVGQVCTKCGKLVPRKERAKGDRMKILDLSAGKRAIWFNKNHPLAVYLDKRSEVNPTIVCDTRDIPASAGSGFNLVCWDPPHMNCGPNSNMSKVYGYHTTAEILDTLEKTGAQVHRITTEDALMALKWNNHDIKLERVFALLPGWEPLFGHLTKDGPGSQTYWAMLRRVPIRGAI